MIERSAPARLDALLRRAGDPWPTGAEFGSRGLEIAGALAADLAQRYGTPLLVVDEEDFRARCATMRGLYPLVMYAVKAFTCHPLIRIALEEGLDLLTSTDGEVEACLRAGAPAARITLHGNNKSDAELAMAVSEGLGLVVVDNRDELERLDAAARASGSVVSVLIRVIPEVDADTHPAIATGHAESKFGIPLDQAVDAAKISETLPGLRFTGVHAHVGSQVLDAEPYVLEVEALLGLLEQIRDSVGIEAEVLDIGGGFGITYVDQEPVPAQDLARAVTERLERGALSRRLSLPQIAVEPGRSLSGPSAITLYRVGAVKETAGRTLAALDGGMSDNIRPALYGSRYTVAFVGARRTLEQRTFTLVGRHCESGDILARDIELPEDLRAGDLVAFAATGAYTYSMASNYNRVGRQAVVGVREGVSTLWLRREDAADLDRLETSAFSREPETAALSAGIVVRPARPRDARSFLEFWTAVVAEGRYVRTEKVSHPARVYRKRFRRPWTDKEAQIVAAEGRRVVGHLFIQRDDHPVTRHVATLGIAVAAGHRGRGIGNALMSEALRWARTSGVEKIVLSVYPHNRPAIALYRKFGFVEEGRLARHSRKSYGYEDEILMGAWLGSRDLSGER